MVVKRIIPFLCIGLFLLLCTKVTFNKQYDRNKSIPIPINIQNKVCNETLNMNFEEILDYCLDLTCEMLVYNSKENLTDSLYNSKGHCVTYSTIYKELCNIAFQINNIEASASVSVGYFTCLGININKCLMSVVSDKYANFVKNHDVVEISYNKQKILIDPSVADIFIISPKYKLKEL